MRHPEHLTATVILDRHSGSPLAEQLADQLCAAIDRGVLPGNARMPSTRTLRALLGVSRGVTLAAYDMLTARGYVEALRGSGTYVAARARRTRAAPPAAPPGRPGVVDLTPGQPCTEAFPLAAWRTGWRRASHAPPPASPPPAMGIPELRRAIAAHLLRTKGITPSSHEIAVTAGRAHALQAVLATFRDSSTAVAVAVEEPADVALRRAVHGAGCQLLALPVDREGAQVAAIPAGCRVVVLSADGPGPLGHVLSRSRRRMVLDWARATGGNVVEVACDGAARPSTGHLPRLLEGPDAESVTLVGGVGDLFGPAIDVGYAVLARRFSRGLAARLRDDRAQPSYVTQLAVAHLLGDGDGARLMRRVGHLHARKRAVVLEVFGALDLFGVDVAGTVGLGLPWGSDSRRIAAGLRGRGILVRPLADYYSSDDRAPSGLVLGYAHLGDAELRESLARLDDALASDGASRGPSEERARLRRS